ncbi:MAG: N-acetylmuramoyl-L-alanine amidase [candidate division WOR-3 bacterium]
MTNKETVAVRLLLDPLQGKKGPLLYHKERRSSLELRLILGCRTDSGFVQELGLLSLTSRSGLMNSLQLDTASVGTSLIWTFRVPMQETIINRANGIEVRLFPRPPRRVNKIVLDPGHGGADPGAIGRKGTQEKTIVLDIAQRVKKHLIKEGFEVILTREKDETVTLAERVEKATNSNADIFVSIHANWAPNRKACGLETYFLSEAKTDWERAVAARENAVFEREISNPLVKNDDPVSLILADLAQNEFLLESSELALRIQETTLPVLKSNDRGVRQANFYVLRNIFMPAVLVECGFLSNLTEEKLLRQPEHREKIARAIAKGVATFIRDYERRLNGKRL